MPFRTAEAASRFEIRTGVQQLQTELIAQDGAIYDGFNFV